MHAAKPVSVEGWGGAQPQPHHVAASPARVQPRMRPLHHTRATGPQPTLQQLGTERPWRIKHDPTQSQHIRLPTASQVCQVCSIRPGSFT